MKDQTVFLTGATGFIGSRLAGRLLERGARLRCLVRSPRKAAHLRSRGAEILEGDVTDRTSLRQGMRGCTLAYHLAAVYDLGIVDTREMRHTNVEGTRAFLDSVAATRLPKAVHVSSTAALTPALNGLSESVIESPGPFPSLYHETKALAHGVAREAQERDLPLVIVCPATVYGPGSKDPLGRFIAELLRGSVPGLLTDPAWLSFVHVDDVAEGLLRAGELGHAGATYVLGGDAESLNMFARRVAALGNVRLPVLRFPPALASVTGRLLDQVSRLTGKRFSITRENVAATAHYRWLHSDARARLELGWQPRSLDLGLPETVAWYKRQRN